MVIKVIFIIIAIVYYLYSKGKKAQEEQQQKQQRRTTTGTSPYEQSQQPKNEKTIDEILRDLQQQIESANQPQQQAQPKQETYTTYSIPEEQVVEYKPVVEKQVEQYTSKSTDILLHERKMRDMAYEEGKGGYEPVYERELTDEEKIERGNLKLQNEGAYKIETEEEIAAHNEAYFFDARQALISSIILERPYK